MINKRDIEVLQENKLSYNVEENSEDENICGNVVISIEDMLKQLPSINGKSRSIYRVPKQLGEMSPKAYAPQVISIGPFHHGCQKDFRDTEQHKLRALINFLRRINNDNMKCSLEDLVKKAHSWMKDARNCYAEPIQMDDHDFLKIMLVDACFIIEFFMLDYDRYEENGGRFNQIPDNVDLTLLCEEKRTDIFYDLIKLENQVPFFLLQSLFDLIPKHDVPMISSFRSDDEDHPISLIDLTDMALKCLELTHKYEINDLYEKEPKHLVDFLSFYFVPLPPDDMQKKQDEKNSEKKNNYFLSFFCCLWNKEKSENESLIITPSITELSEAGATIKKAENAKNLRNITFKNGVLEIPPILIYDEFELMLRNIVAFEQISAGNKNMYATQYVLFLDDLISTEKDVSLLVKAGVIINNIGGNDKEVSSLFNHLGKFVSESSSTYFDDIRKALREHCNGRWNKAKASLKHNYFNTPWAIISFFAATFLILLTLLQTIFSAISAFPN
ncbi:unnamed protein product [Citrullus colocynthis]|uniref:Uncharacterized protein n=1 Tax=Citrullus colocynthis TaxID=252529 RepID=A0ABP0XXE9_9ROSI